MFKILSKQQLNRRIKKVDVKAPEIAACLRPGQFVVVVPDRFSSRIALTTIETDAGRGIVSLIFEENHPSLKRLGALRIGDELFAFIGPLGRPLELRKKKTVICLSEDKGVAGLVAVCRAYKDMGTKVIGIAGFASKKDLLMESQVRISCNKIFIATADGSYERRAEVTKILEEVLAKEKVSMLYAQGPVGMLKEITPTLKARKINSLFNLAYLLTDGTQWNDTSFVNINGRLHQMVVDDVFVDLLTSDLKNIENKLISHREFVDWQSQDLPHNQSRSESRIFPKLFADLVKNKP